MNLESYSLIQICSMPTGQIVIYQQLPTIIMKQIPSTIKPKKSDERSLFDIANEGKINERKMVISCQQQSSLIMCIVCVIFAMIIAVQKTMHIPLTQSLKIKAHPDREEIFKQTDPHFRHKRPISHISNTCITKTIVNCTVLPQNIPKAIEERQFFKSLAPRPFFSKHRKMTENNKKENKRGKGLKVNNSDVCLVTTDFTQILKAKSTVIKQKKLQQFYINREGRRNELNEIHHCGGQNFKSNLFKPYFPKKSHKMRRNSFYLQKSIKVTDSFEVPAENLKIYNRNTLSFAENPAIELEDYALKEKETVNTIISKIPFNKPNITQQKERPRRRQRWREKQNLQFELQPWGNIEPDQSFF